MGTRLFLTKKGVPVGFIEVKNIGGKDVSEGDKTCI